MLKTRPTPTHKPKRRKMSLSGFFYCREQRDPNQSCFRAFRVWIAKTLSCYRSNLVKREKVSSCGRLYTQQLTELRLDTAGRSAFIQWFFNTIGHYFFFVFPIEADEIVSCVKRVGVISTNAWWSVWGCWLGWFQPHRMVRADARWITKINRKTCKRMSLLLFPLWYNVRWLFNGIQCTANNSRFQPLQFSFLYVSLSKNQSIANNQCS